MAGAFAQGLLEEIRSRIDMVELVGQWVRLKRAGQNYKGLCPFHTEKTPSFTVNPKRGIYHCFGCGAGGDAFGFLMRRDRLAFPDAVRMLAERAGVPLPDERPGAAESLGKLETLRRVMAAAQEFYSARLWGPQGDKPRRYLADRGVDLDVARRFGLGHAPEGWTNLMSALGTSAAEEDLVQAGLVSPRQSSPGFYDRFRGRLTFPIRDPQGRVVAFGARALNPGDEPEVPELARDPALQQGTDGLRARPRARGHAREEPGHRGRGLPRLPGGPPVRLHARPWPRSAPPSRAPSSRCCGGTPTRWWRCSTPTRPARRRRARLEELIGDGGDLRDLGWSVARTGRFERPGYFAVNVALLPAGHDPDSLLRAEGAPALEACLRAARPVLAFVLDRALTEEDLTTARGRATAHRAGHPHPVPAGQRRGGDGARAREAAQRLSVDETQLWIEAQQLMGARSRGPRGAVPDSAAPTAGAAPALDSFERDLVMMLVTVEEARAELLAVMEPSDITHLGLARC